MFSLVGYKDVSFTDKNGLLVNGFSLFVLEKVDKYGGGWVFLLPKDKKSSLFVSFDRAQSLDILSHIGQLFDANFNRFGSLDVDSIIWKK